jgi:NAD(P)-dependent dehydrogenase (short-subunit alcohol dehydrogenase family)
MGDLFDGKVAIVTGGASGIGCALSKQLSLRGAIVIVADINIEGAQQAVSDITSGGGCARAVQLDVSRADDVKKLVDDIAAEYGRLDYMFNNAGIAIGADARDLTLEHWRRIIDVNLLGVIHGTIAAYPLMVKQGFGHIVNTASMAGLIGQPMGIPYVTSKYAIVGLSCTLRVEAADLGVKVSVVCPDYVQTSVWDSPLLKMKKEDLPKPLFKMIDATKAARYITKGVERNQAFIVFPLRARVLWWLHRLSPGLTESIGRKVVKDFRAVRIDS